MTTKIAIILIFLCLFTSMRAMEKNISQANQESQLNEIQHCICKILIDDVPQAERLRILLILEVMQRGTKNLKVYELTMKAAQKRLGTFKMLMQATEDTELELINEESSREEGSILQHAASSAIKDEDFLSLMVHTFRSIAAYLTAEELKILVRAENIKREII